MCPLCLSRTHVYRTGDYGHKERSTITEACARPQPDGEPCGLVHAFAGPLKTDCRALPAVGLHLLPGEVNILGLGFKV